MIAALKAEIKLRQKPPRCEITKTNKARAPNEYRCKTPGTSSSLFTKQSNKCAFSLGNHPPKKYEGVKIAAERKNILKK